MKAPVVAYLFGVAVAEDETHTRVKQQITDMFMIKLNTGIPSKDGGPANSYFWVDDDDKCSYENIFQKLGDEKLSKDSKTFSETVDSWGLKFGDKELTKADWQAHLDQCKRAAKTHKNDFTVGGTTQQSDWTTMQKITRGHTAFLDFQKNFGSVIRNVEQKHAAESLNMIRNLWAKNPSCLVNQMLSVTDLCTAENQPKPSTTNTVAPDSFDRNTLWYTYTGSELKKSTTVPPERAQKIKKCIQGNLSSTFKEDGGKMNDKTTARIVRDNIYFHLCAMEHYSVTDGCERAEKIIDCVREVAYNGDKKEKVMLDYSTNSGDVFILDSCPSSCFPGSSTVLTRKDDFSLATTKVSDLQVGQEVVTATGTTEKILGFVHKSENAHVPMLSVTMENGNVLSATPDHLVFKADGQSTAMSQLEVGHELAVYDASSGHDANRVKAISREQTDGLYVPITLSGTLVVDGAMVSAYASPSMRIVNFDHSIAHFATAPMRHYMNTMYKLSLLKDQATVARNKALIVLPTTAV